MSRAQVVGTTGEALALAHLLARGWLATNVNVGLRNMPGIDLLAVKGDRNLRVAVKTIGWGQHQARWSPGKGERERLFVHAVRPDVVVFVRLLTAGTIEHRVFVVPADRVERDVMEAYRFWHSRPRKDGEPHKDIGQVNIGFDKDDTPGNIAAGFERKWLEFKDAWHVADGAAR